MPFKSKAQQRYMFSQEPEIAKDWAKKYGVPKNLPEKKKSKKSPYAGMKEKKGE